MIRADENTDKFLQWLDDNTDIKWVHGNDILDVEIDPNTEFLSIDDDSDIHRLSMFWCEEDCNAYNFEDIWEEDKSSDKITIKLSADVEEVEKSINRISNEIDRLQDKLANLDIKFRMLEDD